MTYIKDHDFELDYPRGLFPGVSTVNKFGRNPDVDTAAAEDVWSYGGTWVAPTTARIHNIASTSASDTSAGTGAQQIEVQGLNGSYALTTETITLNGTTNVPTVNSYIIIHRMIVKPAGSGNYNVGTITATAQTDGTVTASIAVGENQTLMAIYQVPAGKTAYMRKYYASINATTGGAADVRLWVYPFGEAWQLKHILGLSTSGSSFICYEFNPNLKITEKSLIRLSAAASANNMDISGGFDLVLVDN